MIVTLIVAASTNNAIGINNQLPWHLPTDMKFFKNTTWGMPVIMGRKTFESMNSKPLPGRMNIVISRQSLTIPGVAVVSSIDDAINEAFRTDCKEAFVIGGGEIFANIINDASRLYMTRVHTHLDGDVFFPQIDERKWECIQRRDVPKDDKHAFDFSIEKWERIIPFSVE